LFLFVEQEIDNWQDDIVTDTVVVEYMTRQLLNSTAAPPELSMEKLDKMLIDLKQPYQRAKENTIADGNCFFRYAI
jgi:hypothetical protein